MPVVNPGEVWLVDFGLAAKVRPALLLTGNPADEVSYFDDNPWPASPNGGGSSLELRDPRADNSKPGAWAASGAGVCVGPTARMRPVRTPTRR